MVSEAHLSISDSNLEVRAKDREGFSLGLSSDHSGLITTKVVVWLLGLATAEVV